MSCCPPGSTGYLQAPGDYTPVGAVVSEPGLDAYVTGAGETAILLFSDVWGWNSGRVRAVADRLAEGGRTVVVPKCLQPALRGGTDGDGLPPDFRIGPDTFESEFLPWVREASPIAKFRPVLDGAMAFVKGRGAKAIGVVGFCWGAWAAAQASAAYPEIACAAVFHPSIGLEGLLGGDVAALVAKINCPFYLAAAGNDSADDYGPEGSISKALAARFGDKTVTTRFEEVEHGFVLRGDLAAEKVKRDVGLAMDEALAYLATHLK